MSVSILEVLQNADYNIQHNGALGVMIAKDQLHNAVELLEKGYSLDDEVEPLLEQYGDVDHYEPQAATRNNELFGDMTVSQQTTRENLNDLILQPPASVDAAFTARNGVVAIIDYDTKSGTDA